jgi:anaerobic selenocysteine-containing dehydrogenase
MRTATKPWVRVACPHDCPDTCSMLVEVAKDANGMARAISLRGNPEHPTTAGVLCTKVAHYLERTYSPQRLATPLKRIGKKGEGRFAPIGWDEALAEVLQKFRAVAATDPQGILPYHYAGTMGLVQSQAVGKRFFNRLGASVLEETICAEAGSVGWKATYGAMVGTDPEAFVGAGLILIWGANPVVSSLHLWRIILAAKRQGAKLICIDPLRTETAQRCHQHIAPLPGTDAAFALAMMHVLIEEDRLDHDYIDRYTHGFAELAERARGWTPQRAAAICQVPAEVIVALAREYASDRPAAIRLNYGLQRTHGGGNAVRAIGCLPALTGAWRHPSGGALLSCSGNFAVDKDALERPDLRQKPARSVNMSALGDALLELRDPPIQLLYVYNSNPAAVAPDANRVREGLRREDLFVVVHDLFQTDTADYADIVLPATSQLEHADIHKPYGHLYALASSPAMAPLGEALPNSEVFRRLAAGLGFTDDCFLQNDEAIAAAAFSKTDPRTAHFDWEAMRERGFQRLDLPTPFAPYADGRFPTPTGKCELYSTVLAAQGLDPLPDFVAPYESVQSNPALGERYPLALITPPARNFLNTSFANLPRFIDEEVAPRLDLDPADAARRGLADGNWARVFNDRGHFLARVRISEKSRPRQGVASAPSIWWHKLSPGGHNCNAVTSQALADLGGSATFYDCLVEVEKAEKPAPPST